jgi:hypothetical protein
MSLEKYLLPWKFVISGEEHQYRRELLIRSGSFYCVWLNQKNKWVWSIVDKEGQRYETAENAMRDLDKYLIKEGWILIPEGKEDIYMVLI